MTRLQTKEDVLKILHELDDLLVSRQYIELCGTACLLLQGYGFRGTIDIDISKGMSAELLQKAQNFPHVIDFGAQGVISLLEDYEERLVPIKDNFKNLQVRVLSLQDWAVSKLASPKLDDLWEQKLVSKELLNWIEANMYKYCGINEARALADLKQALLRLDAEIGK